MKKIVAVLLIIVMTFSAFSFSLFEETGLFPIARAAGYKTGDIIQFGTYPQTLVTDRATIAKLNAVDLNWVSYRYYTGNYPDNYEEMLDYLGRATAPNDFMMFADFFCEGKKYRAVQFDAYRPADTYTGYIEEDMYVDWAYYNYYQRWNGYKPATIYYFEYEPLSWRILDPKTGYIICDSIIDSQPFNNISYYDGSSWQWNSKDNVFRKFANDYAASSLFEWLNQDFYQTAFTEKQCDNIAETTVYPDVKYNTLYHTKNAVGKIHLLSSTETINKAYGFNEVLGTEDTEKQIKGTDYAQSQGLHMYMYDYNGVLSEEVSPFIGNACWWLRSNVEQHCENSYYVDYSGVISNYPVYHSEIGVRPVCHLSELKSDTSVADTLFSELKENGNDVNQQNSGLFTLGRDNNSFWHNDGCKRVDKKKVCDEKGNYVFISEEEALMSNCGFYKQINHYIYNSRLRQKLLSYCQTDTEKEAVLDAMYSDWNGSCYGIAEAMAMVYLGYLSIDDISSYPASDFYHMELPYKNPQLSDTINYYYCSQYIIQYGKGSSECIATTFDAISLLALLRKNISENNNYQIYSNSLFWKKLIDAVEQKKMVLLVYQTKTGSSHAIVACDIEEPVDNQYRIKLYDMNHLDQNSFDILTIKKNLLSYDAIFSNKGNYYFLDELDYMFFMPLDNAAKIVPHLSSSNRQMIRNAEKEDESLDNTMVVLLPCFGNYKIDFENGQYLYNNGDQTKCNLEILDCQMVIKDEQNYIKLLLKKQNVLTVSEATNDEITVFDCNDYFRVSGEGIESIQIDFNKGITLEGTDYSFSAAVDCNEEEVELTDITGKATGSVNISAGDSVVVDSDGQVVDATVERISEEKKETVTDNVSFSKIQINKDNTVDIENSTDEKEPQYLIGDVDGNGLVESADARLALRASVKLENYPEGSAAFLAADTDHNGVIEASDARLILRASVKLDTLPLTSAA